MPPRTRAPQDTRQRILDTAFTEFHRNGFQNGSLNRIIEDAAVTKGALFHHYASKEALGLEVIDRVIAARIAQRWMEPLAGSIDPVADITSLLGSMVRRSSERNSLELGCPLNNLAQEMSPLNEKFRQHIEKIYDAWRASIAAAFERGIEAGQVRKGVAPSQVAPFVVAAIAGIIGTAKNARSKALMTQASAALIQYLESLLPREPLHR